MEFSSLTILLFAFVTGLLHALDADHVMAISALATKRPGFKAILGLCMHWALGHGFTLLLFGSLVMVLGLNIPAQFSHYAESLVAILLIIIGTWILYDLLRNHAHLHFHQHDGMLVHAHWHAHAESQATTKYHQQSSVRAHRHEHGAVLIGIVHGMAGLAPLLAMIPLTKQPVWLSIIYLLLFCLGVFIAMLAFGGVLGRLLQSMQRYGAGAINLLRGLVATGSIALGIVWIS